jgi:hypothetical protein
MLAGDSKNQTGKLKKINPPKKMLADDGKSHTGKQKKSIPPKKMLAGDGKNQPGDKKKHRYVFGRILLEKGKWERWGEETGRPGGRRKGGKVSVNPAGAYRMEAC